MAKRKTAKMETVNVGVGTDTEPPRVVRANVEVHRQTEKGEGYATLYANDAQFHLTPWDIRIVFGQMIGLPKPDDLKLLIRELGEVRMSPQFAKRLATVLVGQIRHYEQTIGPIPLPPE